MFEWFQVSGTHRKKREDAEIFEFCEGSGIAAAHQIDHFLARKRVKIRTRTNSLMRDAQRVSTWLSLNAAFSKQIAPGELPRKKPKSICTTWPAMNSE